MDEKRASSKTQTQKIKHAEVETERRDLSGGNTEILAEHAEMQLGK